MASGYVVQGCPVSTFLSTFLAVTCLFFPPSSFPPSPSILPLSLSLHPRSVPPGHTSCLSPQPDLPLSGQPLLSLPRTAIRFLIACPLQTHSTPDAFDNDCENSRTALEQGCRALLVFLSGCGSLQASKPDSSLTPRFDQIGGALQGTAQRAPHQEGVGDKGGAPTECHPGC